MTYGIRAEVWRARWCLGIDPTPNLSPTRREEFKVLGGTSSREHEVRAKPSTVKNPSPARGRGAGWGPAPSKGPVPARKYVPYTATSDFARY
jgi:hypothetical protein